MEKNIETDYYGLNPHYYKSRNTLLLFSGLLFAWELIGVNFSEFDASGMKITLDNGEALPFVLFVLITYFVFRIIIEWYNSSIKARIIGKNILDHWITLFIPFIAMVTYSIQRWFDISVFQRINQATYSLILVVTIPIITTLCLLALLQNKRFRKFFDTTSLKIEKKYLSPKEDKNKNNK